jgi:hypothetical protein
MYPLLLLPGSMPRQRHRFQKGLSAESDGDLQEIDKDILRSKTILRTMANGYRKDGMGGILTCYDLTCI